jgi:quercetin dioxygenase-like cupin family protein
MNDKSLIEKGAVHIIVEIIEYIPNAVVSRVIIKKTTGNITATSVDTGEEIIDRTSAFDIYVQIINGAAELVINGKSFYIKLGEGIVIPAHSTHSFFAKEQFKMICTVIKSGYEE